MNHVLVYLDDPISRLNHPSHISQRYFSSTFNHSEEFRMGLMPMQSGGPVRTWGETDRYCRAVCGGHRIGNRA